MNGDGDREASRANYWLEDERVDSGLKKGKAHGAPSSLGVVGPVGVGTLPNGPEPLCVRPSTSQ